MTITTILSPLDHGQAMESLSDQVDWRVAAACLRARGSGSGTVIANRGDIYNCFHVAKHRGQWHIEESRIEDLRAMEDRAELLRRGQPSI